MNFPIIPLGISVGVAAADGVVASMDADAWAKSTVANKPASQPILQRKTTWLQGGAIGLGLLGEFADWHADITESLMFTGAALFAREVAFQMTQGRNPAASQIGAQGFAQQGFRSAVPAPAPALNRSNGTQQIPGSAGFLKQQLPSVVG